MAVEAGERQRNAAELYSLCGLNRIASFWYNKTGLRLCFDIPKGGLHDALYAGVPAPYWAPPAPVLCPLHVFLAK